MTKNKKERRREFGLTEWNDDGREEQPEIQSMQELLQALRDGERPSLARTLSISAFSLFLKSVRVRVLIEGSSTRVGVVHGTCVREQLQLQLQLLLVVSTRNKKE